MQRDENSLSKHTLPGIFHNWTVTVYICVCIVHLCVCLLRVCVWVWLVIIISCHKFIVSTSILCFLVQCDNIISLTNINTLYWPENIWIFVEMGCEHACQLRVAQKLNMALERQCYSQSTQESIQVPHARLCPIVRCTCVDFWLRYYCWY